MLQTGQGLANIAHHGVHLFFLDEDDGEPLAARHAGDRVFVEDILRADPGTCRFGVEGMSTRQVVIPDGIWEDPAGNSYRKGIYPVDTPITAIPVFRRIGK